MKEKERKQKFKRFGAAIIEISLPRWWSFLNLFQSNGANEFGACCVIEEVQISLEDAELYFQSKKEDSIFLCIFLSHSRFSIFSFVFLFYFLLLVFLFRFLALLLPFSIFVFDLSVFLCVYHSLYLSLSLSVTLSIYLLVYVCLLRITCKIVTNYQLIHEDQL